MEKTFVLTVPNAPKSINTGGGGTRANPYVAHKEKTRWEGLFLMELLAAKVPKPMQFCVVSVTLRFKHRSGGKGRDTENYRQPVIKPLLDALVKGGYLKDDTDEWVRVADFTLEQGSPDTWSHRDPRVKVEQIIRLEASYL